MIKTAILPLDIEHFSLPQLVQLYKDDFESYRKAMTNLERYSILLKQPAIYTVASHLSIMLGNDELTAFQQTNKEMKQLGFITLYSPHYPFSLKVQGDLDSNDEFVYEDDEYIDGDGRYDEDDSRGLFYESELFENRFFFLVIRRIRKFLASSLYNDVIAPEVAKAKMELLMAGAKSPKQRHSNKV